MTRALTVLLFAGEVFAQPQPSVLANTGSISGVVREGSTGSSIAEASVYLDRNSRTGKETKTDAQGRYTFTNITPGPHRVSAQTPFVAGGGFPVSALKSVTLAEGQELGSLNFSLAMHAEISGKVVDQNKEPTPGISVVLIAREYALGSLRYVYAAVTTTDDLGEYTLKNVRPGRAYLLMAQKRTYKLPAVSEAPMDPRFRKQAVVTTYYPGTATAEGAEPFVMRPAERRTGVDIRVLRSPSYCVDGIVQAGAGPQELSFSISERQPTSGAHGDGAMFIMSPTGSTATDGKLRVCDLAPGDYTLTAYSKGDALPTFYGSTEINVVDRDVRNVIVAARPRVQIPGEVVWQGEPPDPSVTSQSTILLRPLTRAPYTEEVSDVKSNMPGQFLLASVLVDSYSVRLLNVPPDAYVKELTYAGQNLLTEPLLAGSDIGDTSIRVVLSRDGGTVSAKVADKDGNPVADARVVLVPITVASEAALAAAVTAGQCDQNGAWTSGRVAPGKYYAVGLERAHDNSPESLGRLWASRTHFKEIEIAPKGSLQVTLTPLALQ